MQKPKNVDFAMIFAISIKWIRRVFRVRIPPPPFCKNALKMGVLIVFGVYKYTLEIPTKYPFGDCNRTGTFEIGFLFCVLAISLIIFEFQPILEVGSLLIIAFSKVPKVPFRGQGL